MLRIKFYNPIKSFHINEKKYNINMKRKFHTSINCLSKEEHDYNIYYINYKKYDIKPVKSYVRPLYLPHISNKIEHDYKYQYCYIKENKTTIIDDINDIYIVLLNLFMIL